MFVCVMMIDFIMILCGIFIRLCVDIGTLFAHRWDRMSGVLLDLINLGLFS